MKRYGDKKNHLPQNLMKLLNDHARSLASMCHKNKMKKASRLKFFILKCQARLKLIERPKKTSTGITSLVLLAT